MRQLFVVRCGWRGVGGRGGRRGGSLLMLWLLFFADMCGTEALRL